MKSYYLYIMGNERGVIYTGVTSDLERRIWEHKNQVYPGFASKYDVNRLLYFEEFTEIEDANIAEKRVKGWKRSKKLDLIRSKNPKFKDLSEDFFFE